MKKMKKFMALLMAVVIMMAMSVTVMAEDTTSKGTITITPPTGVNTEATNTYQIYKVFDATVSGDKISYKLMSRKTDVPCNTFVADIANNVYHFSGMYVTEGTENAIAIQVATETGTETKYIVPTSGTLSKPEIDAIATYVGAPDVTADYTAESKGSANATVTVDYGYYYITTTTGSVVSVDSAKATVAVTDKNTVPTLDKVITSAGSVDADGKKALAQVGTDVNYKVTITVGKGAKGYVFHDVMDTGLAYNNDAAVTGVDSTEYTIKQKPDTGDTLTITFADGIDENTKITITYSAKVTSDTLQTSPAVNTAKLNYGKDSSYSTAEQSTAVYNAKFSVAKTDGTTALAGAGFVIKNDADMYYKYTAANADKKTTAKVEWVANISDATEYVSNSNGKLNGDFTGLADGTYTLIENTVPDGYNKAADSTFTISVGIYTEDNLIQSSTVVNNQGTMLPTTGGIGTTMFYIIGGILVVGAAVILITRKRMENE